MIAWLWECTPAVALAVWFPHLYSGRVGVAPDLCDGARIAVPGLDITVSSDVPFPPHSNATRSTGPLCTFGQLDR